MLNVVGAFLVLSVKKMHRQRCIGNVFADKVRKDNSNMGHNKNNRFNENNEKKCGEFINEEMPENVAIDDVAESRIYKRGDA